MPINKAIVLFSGGLDSTTCLAIAKNRGFDCFALTFSYGQKHEIEVNHALALAKEWQVGEHKILTLPFNALGGSSLTDSALTVEDYQQEVTKPATYVPARNTIFLSFALAWGEVLGINDIFIGANQIDYSNYPDCRSNYFAAFEAMAKLATRYGEEKTIKIHAPLINMKKADIIREGVRLGIDYTKTVSCYRADALGRACGKCDSCYYRKKGFAEALIEDQTKYY